MGYNILLIDDSMIVRQVIKKSLGLTNLEINQVFEAGNGLEALNLLEESWIDIIFLDINMPIMNGVEFIDKLRANEEHRNTPVIVISTEGARERKAQLADKDVRAYLRKPVTPELLTETINETLGSSEGYGMF